MSQRFTVQGELNRIDKGLRRDAQHDWGTEVQWWRYDPESEVHDTYDVGSPRQWRPYVIVPVLSAIALEGRDTHDDLGLYTSETIEVVVTKQQLRDYLYWHGMLNREGLQSFLRDRIGYEDRVYTITSAQLEGQLHQRDTIVAISGKEVRSDEQLLDEQPEPDGVYDDPA